jgi:hypothetical protein
VRWTLFAKIGRASRLWVLASCCSAASGAFAEANGVSFEEVAQAVGLSFDHDSGKRGKLWTLEITGAGVGLLDYDDDGRMDVWLVQGGPIDARDGALPSDRLYRNESVDGELRFRDVTAEAGIRATEYGMGIATGDVDNDGDVDVFLANYGSNQLFINTGDGRFRDATEAFGITGDAWSIATSFADFDGDGWLDLYVGNYLEFSIEDYEACRRWSTRPTYCAPNNFTPAGDRLYKNVGGKRFEDVTQRGGIGGAKGGAMGVAADDFDGDGDLDFYVANDGVDNLMWLNQGDGRFVDDALLAGTAVNADGVAEASMGIAVGDFDMDGDADIFVTHDVKESNTLYRNELQSTQQAMFADQSHRVGLAVPSLPYSAFGTGWLDVENDGDLDLFLANGAVAVIEEQAASGIEPPLKQPNVVMVNDGEGKFSVLSGFTDVAEASRGAALGDLDNDGDADVIVANNHGPAQLYRNDSASGNWLGLNVVGSPEAPHAYGALVWRESRAERKRVRTDGSYASAQDPRLLFGLGSDDVPQFVRVRWRDGLEEKFGPLDVNRYHTLRYGSGRDATR